MTKLLDKIRKYKDAVCMQTAYTWKIPALEKNIFSDDDIMAIKQNGTVYEANICLKSIIKEKTNGNYCDNDLNFWIINSWGHIPGFKRIDKNEKKIVEFKKQLDGKQLSREMFSTISSLSKISAFVEPYEYAIYDARVTFSLNCLIMKTENERFFPMPTTRNTKLKKVDLENVILSKYKPDSFYNYREAYFVFCDLIKELSIELYGQQAPLYHLEMLLFSIAVSKNFLDDIESQKIWKSH